MKTLCAPFAFPGLKGTTGRSRQPFFPRPRAQNIMARIALIRLSRYGGVEQFAFRLAEALAETRNSEHEVEFICARSECLPPVGVRTHIVGRPGGLKFIKMLFWDPEDEVIQFFPPQSEYINFHKNCLHLWRPTNVKLPWSEKT